MARVARVWYGIMAGQWILKGIEIVKNRSSLQWKAKLRKVSRI
jgi:hypothetical protein